MMCLALMLRPWMLIVREAGSIPRTLADDMLVISSGPSNLSDFVTQFDFTFQFLIDLGAKPAANKSYTFSSDTRARAWLITHFWRVAKSTVDCVIAVRDLGAHISTGASLFGATLAGRFKQAIRAAKNLKH